jgi:hypothetical protein
MTFLLLITEVQLKKRYTYGDVTSIKLKRDISKEVKL